MSRDTTRLSPCTSLRWWSRAPADDEIAQKVVALFANTALDVRIIPTVTRLRWERIVQAIIVGGIAALMRARVE